VFIACGVEILLIHNKLLEIQIKMVTALTHSLWENVQTKHGLEFLSIMLQLKTGGSRMIKLQVMLISK